jgi:hypothetical protein
MYSLYVFCVLLYEPSAVGQWLTEGRYMWSNIYIISEFGFVRLKKKNLDLSKSGYGIDGKINNNLFMVRLII